MAQNKTAIIQAALLALDVKNDEMWTSDGSPRIDSLGIPGLKRAEIVAAAPQFSRTNFTVETNTLSRDGSYLLGSSVQPDIFYLRDGATKQLGDIVASACETSELTVDEWNDLTEEEREVFIQIEVDKLDILYEDEINSDEDAKPREDLESKRLAALQELEAAKKKTLDAAKIEKIASDKHDAIVNQIETARPTQSTQMDIMDYIASQQKIRAARAAKHSQFIAAGVDFSKIGPAPIDAAMGRKNQRGTKRPIRAVMGNANEKQG